MRWIFALVLMIVAHQAHRPADMPVVEDATQVLCALPAPQRGPAYRRYLAATVMITVSGSSGSGTICHYDPRSRMAYVATCGHLWPAGTLSSEQAKKKPLSCKITAWYGPNKLDRPKEYTGRVHFYSNVRGADTALVAFSPDWVPDTFPIAPIGYKLPQGTKLHSVGCDGGGEVAHYDVEVVGIQGGSLVTKDNSPRPGRSGGGLLSGDGWQVGTCWGTSKLDGSGLGFFTPLASLHAVWGREGYGWLLGAAEAARKIPVVDRARPSLAFPGDYIPLPAK
jgi:hypothetical protein